MKIKCLIATIFFLILEITFATESYMDYGDENAERNVENIREFYRSLLRHNSVGDLPYEHLMIRKSQRSPSLRLRFGRSDPSMPRGNLLMKVTSSEDN